LTPSLATPLDVRQGCVRRAAVAGRGAHSIIKLQRAARGKRTRRLCGGLHQRAFCNGGSVFRHCRGSFIRRWRLRQTTAVWRDGLALICCPEHAAGNRSRLFERRYGHAGGRKQRGRYEESQARLLTSCRLSGSGRTTPSIPCPASHCVRPRGLLPIRPPRARSSMVRAGRS
jgi:hypothetical protein